MYALPLILCLSATTSHISNALKPTGASQNVVDAGFRVNWGKDRNLNQIGAFQDLVDAKFDGVVPIHALKAMGNMGVGTFNGIDGEMVVLDGNVYQVNSFGDVSQPKGDTLTPFACVDWFVPTKTKQVTGHLTQRELEQTIDKMAGDPNALLAIEVKGNFDNLVARAFPKQLPPYIGYAKLAGRENRFPFAHTDGTMVGFRLPKSVGTQNVAGYHFHFLNGARTHGGHILSYEVSNGTVQVMRLSKISQVRVVARNKKAASVGLSRVALNHRG